MNLPEISVAIQLVVWGLATFRLTRLVVTDTLPPIVWVREFVLRHVKKEGSIAELIECPWCTSYWVSIGVVAFGYFVPWSFWVLLPFALSAAAGLLSSWEPE